MTATNPSDTAGTDTSARDWSPDLAFPTDRPNTGGAATALPSPIDWDQLPADELEAAWYELDDWVTWLRHTYGLPATVLPPAWHRHPELVWELSALHLHWLGAYHPTQNPSAPLGWHRDLTDALERLRNWTTTAGTRLDHDRPTRHTTWPGEPPPPADASHERPIEDRHTDFLAHVTQQVQHRRGATGQAEPRPGREEQQE